MNKENQPNPYLKSVLLPYIVYIMLFIGTGFLSGAVVHYPINPSFFLVIGLIGVAIFTIASTVQEAVYHKKNLKAEGIIPFILYSIILSIGIGMISGGIQHFEQYPIYASYLIPIGIAVSFVTFLFKNNLKLSLRDIMTSVLFGGLILLLLWILLSKVAHETTPGGHPHGEPTLSSTDQEHLKTTQGTSPASVPADSYSVALLSSKDNLLPNKETELRYQIKDSSGQIVKNFEIAHEKLMHLIVVREDLQYFQHVHPEFDQNKGEFRVPVTFPTDGKYRLFPDFTVPTNGEKKGITLSFDLNVGNAEGYQKQTVVPDSITTKTAGDYTIEYGYTSSPLKAGQETTYSVLVQKEGQTVKNLENYLGARGHSVILKEGTLDFIHTHALENTGKDAIEFATTFPSPGKYKIFTQFQHEGKVTTSNYVVEVQNKDNNTTPSSNTEHGGGH